MPSRLVEKFREGQEIIKLYKQSTIIFKVQMPHACAYDDAESEGQAKDHPNFSRF